MNLNANQIKVLAYIRPYVGRDMPTTRVISWALGIPYSTIVSSLQALERGGMAQVEWCGQGGGYMRRRKLTYCANVPHVSASNSPPEASRASWERTRRHILSAEGLREGTQR